MFDEGTHLAIRGRERIAAPRTLRSTNRRGWPGALLLPALVAAALGTSGAAGHPDTIESRIPRETPAPIGDPLDRLALSDAARYGASLAFEEGTSLTPTEAAALGDADAATRVALAAGDRLEFHFEGAPRWIDHVRLDASSDAPNTAQIELLGDDGWVDYVRSEIQPQGGVVELAGAPFFAQGLRLSTSAGSGSSIGELSAQFQQSDPDHGALLGSNLYDYDWVNSYPWTNDLSKCDNDARGLRDHLPGGWAWAGHGNSDSHEHHYKRDDLGTGNNTDHLDWADLSYFSGHGSGTRDDWYYDEDLGAFLFGEEVDDVSVVPGDARAAWGNGNCEWQAMSSCQTLRGASWDYWYEAMDGLHMILGASTNVLDKNYGTSWARRMVDSGIFDSAHGVRSSWAYSLDLHNWDGTAVVIAETSANGGDHLWGEGSVSDDSSNNNLYHWWTYDLGWFARQNQSPLDEALIHDRASYAAPARAGLLPKLAPGGMDVLIDPTLLQGAMTSQQLPCYNVVPFTVGDTYVRSIANAICQSQTVLCGGTIGSSGEGERNLIVGSQELRVNEATGNFEYVDVSQWLAWKKTRPQLPPESAAQAIASSIAAQWPGMPQGGIYAGADFAWQGARPVGGNDIPDSSFATSIRLKYERRIGGMKVRGGGGRWSVEIGAGNRPQRVSCTGWRNLTTGGMVDILPTQTVVDAIRTYGWNAAIDGVRVPIDVLTITNLELGYYEPPLFEPASKVCPCYIVSGTVGSQGAPVQFCVWADATMPQGSILSPPEGSSVVAGSTVCMVGTGSGGVAPLSFRWLDEAGTQLGTGTTVCTPIDILPAGDEGPSPRRTIELVVKDALGHETSRYLHLNVSAPSGIEESGPVAGLEISAAAPNPFVSSTVLSYALPASSDSERTRLIVHDVSGRAIRTLVDAVQPSGRYQAVWDGLDDRGRRVANGTYFYRLALGKQVRSVPVTLLR